MEVVGFASLGALGAALVAIVLIMRALADRRREVEELTARFEALDATNRTLAETNAKLEERCRALEDDLKRVQRIADEAAEGRRAIRIERDDFAAKLSASEASLAAEVRARKETEAQAAQGTAEAAALRDKLAKATAERAALEETLKQERAAAAERMEKERAVAAEKLALVENARERMSREFKDLADQVLRRHGEDFRKANEEKLELVLAPLKQHLDGFEKELREVHASAAKERTALATEMKSLTKRSEEVSREAENLARALKGDTQRQGAWGEMVLESLLERSGLRAGEEYLVQAHQRDEEGRALRPDVVVRLPGGRSLVVDSKVSLTAYEEAVNAGGEEDRAAALRRHVMSVRSHIDALSAKAYHRLDDGAADYVIMFMPIEGALSEALRERGDLTAYAAEKNVMIATPTTLMMTLRTIENVWAVERRNANAEDIAKRAGRLYDKLAGFIEDMKKVGDALDRARKSHGDALGKLSTGQGNALRQIEQLKALGAKASKSISIEFDGKQEIEAGRLEASAEEKVVPALQ